MAKIQLEYLVPDGDCMHTCDDVDVTPPCKYLHGYKWCVLFGAGPIITMQGHTVIYHKLHQCAKSTLMEYGTGSQV